MTHLELADEDVELASVLRVVDHEAVVHADEAVEPLVRHVARVDEQLQRLAIAPPLRDQIDVAIRPSQRGVHLAARVQCDCDATDDAERHAPGRRQIADAQGLGRHARVGARIHRANVRGDPRAFAKNDVSGDVSGTVPATS